MENYTDYNMDKKLFYETPCAEVLRLQVEDGILTVSDRNASGEIYDEIFI